MDNLASQLEEYGPYLAIAAVGLLIAFVWWRGRRANVRIGHDDLLVGSRHVPWTQIKEMSVRGDGNRRFALTLTTGETVEFEGNRVEGTPDSPYLADVLAARAGLVRTNRSADGTETWLSIRPSIEGPAFPASVPVGQPEPARKGMVARGGILAAIIAVLAKAKFLLVALKFGKIVTTAGTMLVSIVLYSFFYGWVFAVGFVLLILVHELGHAAMLASMGIPITAPIFIPFLGAFVGMKEAPKDAKTEAITAYAGPFVGTLAAFACYGIGLATGKPLWLALAATGFFLNLFNLIPVSPLDGGRVAAGISPKLWYLGLPILLALFFLTKNPLMLIMVIFGGVRAYQTSKMNAPELAGYYSVPARTRWLITLAYVGLLAVLGFMYMHTQALHGPLERHGRAVVPIS